MVIIVSAAVGFIILALPIAVVVSCWRTKRAASEKVQVLEAPSDDSIVAPAEQPAEPASKPARVVESMPATERALNIQTDPVLVDEERPA